MSPELWIPICVGGAGVVAWWIVQRFVGNVDKLERNMHGDDGTIAKLRADIAAQIQGLKDSLKEYVTQEELDVNLARIADNITNLRHEGGLREQHILDSISGHYQRLDAQLKQIDKEIGTRETGLRGELHRIAPEIALLRDRIGQLLLKSGYDRDGTPRRRG